MIDVTLNPAGRSLMTMMMGVLKYQAVVKAKNIENFKKDIETIKTLRTEQDFLTDLSVDMTTRMMDKRFKDPTFKKSTSESDKALKYIVEKNKLKSRIKLNSVVSQYNQNVLDKKINTSFKLINMNQVL